MHGSTARGIAVPFPRGSASLLCTTASPRQAHPCPALLSPLSSLSRALVLSTLPSGGEGCVAADEREASDAIAANQKLNSSGNENVEHAHNYGLAGGIRKIERPRER